MYSQEEIKKNYQGYDDQRIKRITKQDAKGLRDEVVPILVAEIEKRKLGTHLIKWVKAERRKLSENQLRQLKEKVKKCLCEKCQKNSYLKGYQFTTITSFLISESISDHQLIICQECGKKKRRNSAIWTSIFGWWSARGFLSTPFVLFDKVRALLQEDKQSEEMIEAFIQTNIGTITLGDDKQEVIQKLLSKYNQMEEDIIDD